MSTVAQEAELAGVIDYTRQRDWLDPTQLPATTRVQMVGVGGIGTPTSLLLAKLGIPKFDLIDFDDVERHNLPNQIFPLDSLGEPKVDATASFIESMAPVKVNAHVARIGENGQYELIGDSTGEELALKPRGIVIAALDSMEARANLWKGIKLNLQVPLLIDARLGGENIVVHQINPLDREHIEFYEETLYSDEEARPDPCTRRSVMDVGFAVAALIGRAVRKHLAGETLHKRVFLQQDSLNLYKEE